MKVLIAGATSAIGAAVARRLAALGDEFFLVGRNSQRLSDVAGHLSVCGAAQVETFTADLNDATRHPNIVGSAYQALGGLDLALIAHGILGDQRLCETQPGELVQVLTSNFVSTVSLAMSVAERFERQRSGTIAVITSVAGDRGRRSNYAYGASKGGVSIFLQGLRDRLKPADVAVVDLKVGPVDTPMTASLPKNGLFISPEKAAAGIHRAISRKRDVAYVPWFWAPVMMTLRALPGPVFRRLPI